MAFISHNYLGSDNCKDELSFVRELNKNRVLIYLEDVSLPDEMQMRLGRLQAIYWNRDGEKKSHQKLMLSPGLNICREPAAAAAPAHENHTAPAAVNPAAPAHENPAAPPPETPAAPSPEVKADVKPFPPKSETGDVTQKPATKKNPILFAGIGAVILLILVLALKPKKSPQSGSGTASTPALEYESVFEQDNSREDVPAESNSEDAAVADGDEASEEDDETDVEGDETGVEGDGTGVEGDEADVLTKAASAYSDGVVSSKEGALFAGTLIAYKPYTHVFKDQQDLDYNGDTYTVARLPFITISSFDDQNSIILGFYDKFGADFYFYGTYSVGRGTLTLSPGGSSGSFAYDCAPLTQDLTYKIKLASDTVRLYYDDSSVYVSLCGTQDETCVLTLKGSLSEGSESYSGVQSLDLVYDIANNELKKCVVILADGKSVNVDSCSYYASIHKIILEWSSVDYILNGRPVTEEVRGYLNFAYISQDPAGFMISADSQSGKFCYYQDLSGF